MKQNITIALKTNGTSEMLHGPEVPLQEQKATVQHYRDTDVPEGVDRVELWTRNPGTCVKFAYKQTEANLRRRELEALIAADKAAAESDETAS